jgi:hypothetical protein
LDWSATSTDEDFDDMQSYDSIIWLQKPLTAKDAKKPAKFAKKSW